MVGREGRSEGERERAAERRALRGESALARGSQKGLDPSCHYLTGELQSLGPLVGEGPLAVIPREQVLARTKGEEEEGRRRSMWGGGGGEKGVAAEAATRARSETGRRRFRREPLTLARFRDAITNCRRLLTPPPGGMSRG